MDEKKLRQLKNGVWLYFFLLVFEGALRKWVFPSLSAPLLIVRDPIAIWLLYFSYKERLWNPNPQVILIVFVTILGLISTLIVGHGNIYVALYGFRITAIHFPLIFVIGRIFKFEDVVQMGKVILWITLGMTLLVGFQVFSPQSAWVNRGIGGDIEGSGFGGAAGFFRVPGTFSFTNGLSYYYGLATAFIIYFWMTRKVKVSRILLIVATLALLAAIPLSISRTVLFQIALTVAFSVAISGKNPKMLVRIFSLGILAVCLVVILKKFAFFTTASLAFEERFSSANESEGGLEGVFLDRFLGGMYNAITDDSFEFWGRGIGLGTNAGAEIIMGKRAFLISEGEWGRIIGEMGFVLGLIVIFLRGGVVVDLLLQAWHSVKEENFLPWMLMSFGAVMILQGQWAQPTTLGFSVLIGGLVYSSLRGRKD